MTDLLLRHPSSWPDSVTGDTARDGTPARGVTFWALVLYLFVDYVRPQSFFPAIGALRPGLLVELLLVFLLLAYRDKRPLPAPLWGMFAVVALMGAGVFFAPNQYHAFWTTLDMFLRFLCVVVPMYMFLDDLDKLDSFLNWFLLCNGFIALTAIFRHGAGSGSFLADENDLCMALDTALPLAIFKFLRAPSGLKRIGFGLLTALYLAAIVFSWSRGGFVGLIAVLFWVWLRSPRKLAAVLGIIVLAAGFIILTPAAYWQEMGTIDTAIQGRETGGARLYSWGLAIRMFWDRPLFGWGPQGYPYAVYRFQGAEQYEMANAPIQRSLWGRVSHSVYFTVLPELGLAGTAIFIWLIWSLIAAHRTIRKDCRKSPQAETEPPPPRLPGPCERLLTISLGLDGALVGFLVSGIFLSAFYYPHFWTLLALGMAARAIHQQQVSAPLPAAPTGQEAKAWP